MSIQRNIILDHLGVSTCVQLLFSSTHQEVFSENLMLLSFSHALSNSVKLKLPE